MKIEIMLHKIYKDSLSTLTDLYQLTMANAYWKNERYNDKAVFHLYFRKMPFNGDFAVAAGLGLVCDWLDQLAFKYDDIRYLASIKGNNGRALFGEDFLNFLQRFEFSCDVDALPEGTPVFPNQPIIRVTGPLWQAQYIETALLTMVNFSTLVATKASRIVQAAKGDPILEFGLRRAQGIDGGLTASRSAYIGGCAATSNLLAGKTFGIPVKGTHAHSWVMAFDEELESFSAYADALPHNCIFLVDTYDTEEGVKKAISIGKRLRKEGHEMIGIRLDSGDLNALSQKARKLLDEAGFPDAVVSASNDLDEYRIAELKKAGAKISLWGVGTRLVTSKDQPSLGGVYKLAGIQDEKGDWKAKVKLSEQTIKVSNPGSLQVRRLFNDKNEPIEDILYNEWDYNLPEGKGIDLLVPIYRKGKRVYNNPEISEIRAFSLDQQNRFNKTLENQDEFTVHFDSKLLALKESLIAQHQ